MLDDGDYVPYALVDEGFPDYLNVCPCMVDASTEFVPAIHLHGAFKRPNDEDLGGFFLRVCREHDVDARTPVEKMVVIDYISANWDRHWNNFGVFIDAETREWKRMAPIFDTGESFWCDRKLAQGFGGYTLRKKGSFRPFMRDVDRQLVRYCKDMSWYEPSALSGYVEEVVSVLSQNPLVSNEAGRLEGIAHAIEGRIAAVNRLFELSRKRLTPVAFSVRADAARRAETSAEKSRNADAGERETRKSREAGR